MESRMEPRASRGDFIIGDKALREASALETQAALAERQRLMDIAPKKVGHPVIQSLFELQI